MKLHGRRDDYACHPDENWLIVTSCHLTPFALLGPSAPVGGVTAPLDALATSWVRVLLTAAVAIAGLVLKRRAI